MARPTDTRRRRQRYDADKRLVVSGSVQGTEPVPPRAPKLSRALTALVDVLPAHEESARGRSSAAALRIVIGVAAIWLVTQGKDNAAFAAVGVLLALWLVVVPVAESRKRRWREAAQRLGAPRSATVARAAAVDYDGLKLTITSEDRVWRSVRVRGRPIEVVTGHVGDLAVLGLLTARAREKTLWFTAPWADVRGQTYDPVAPTGGFTPDDVVPETTMTVDGPTWVALHEALWDPATGTVPTARGAAEESPPKKRRQG